MTTIKPRPIPPPITSDSVQTGPTQWVSQGIGRIVQWNEDQGVYQAWDPLTQTWSWGYRTELGWAWQLYGNQTVRWENDRDRRFVERVNRRQQRTIWDSMWVSVLGAVVFFGFSVSQGVGAIGAIVAVALIAWGFAWNWLRMKHPVATDVAETAYVASLVYRGVRWYDRHSH